MRHNRGSGWGRNRQRSRFFQNNQQPNSNITRNPIINQTNPLNTKNLTYVGRCRCGFGPNAYYKTSKGNIIHSSQMNPNPRPKIEKLNITPNLRPPVSNNPLDTGTYQVCNRCGSRVRDDAYFCTECGNELIYPSVTTKKEQVDFIKNRIRDLKHQLKNIRKNNE